MEEKQYSEGEIKAGIAKIYAYVTSTKNVTSRYIIILALSALFLDAFDFAAFSFGVDSFKTNFPYISKFTLGVVAGSVDLGAFFGAFIGGWLTDKIGRRFMFILNMILFVVMALLAGFSTNPYEAIVFRTLLGFALGADTATGFTYIFEFLETKQRLFWSNLWQEMWYLMYLGTIGFLVFPFYLYVHSLTNPMLWRIIMWSGAGLAIVILIFRSKIPESILWNAYKGKLSDALKGLKKAYGVTLEGVPDVNYDMTKKEKNPSIFSIFRKSKARELIYVFNGAFEQSLIFYTFGFYLPYILLTLHLAGSLATIEATAIYYGAGAVAGVLTAFLTNKIGTKAQYVIGALLEGTSLILLGLTIQVHMALGFLVGFAGSFFFFHVIGPASQEMTSANAYFGTHERGTAAGWTYFFVKTAAVVGLFLGPTLLAIMGALNLSYVLGGYGIATGILGLFIGYDARTYRQTDLEEVESLS